MEDVIPLLEKMVYAPPENSICYFFVTGLMFQILSFQCSYFSKIEIASKEKDTKNYYIQKSLDIISQKYMTNISVNDIAKKLYISSGYLGNIFRDQLGISPMMIITRTRMECAKRLLESDNDIRCNEISILCGYDDYKHFYKCFKKYYGLSPSEFKKRND